MPKRHGQLEEYSIGPSKGSTANCAQLNAVQQKKIMSKHVAVIRGVSRAGSIYQISVTFRRFQRGGFSRASEIAESPKRQMSISSANRRKN
jgi:hypothetical protein